MVGYRREYRGLYYLDNGTFYSALAVIFP